jgi:hypothetical protein
MRYGCVGAGCCTRRSQAGGVEGGPTPFGCSYCGRICPGGPPCGWSSEAGLIAEARGAMRVGSPACPR